MSKITATTIGLGQQGIEQAFSASLEPDRLGHNALLFPLGIKRHDFALNKAPYLGAELFVVFAVNSSHE